MFKLNNVINWSGFRNINNLLPNLHSKGLTGTVMNKLPQTYGSKSLAYGFLFEKVAPHIYKQLADEMGVTPEEWMRLISLEPQPGDPIIRVQKEMKEKINDTLMGVLANKIKDEQVKNLKQYYGVTDASGLEFFCPAEYWESDDLQIRTGGHKFWLNWCKNGGRNGSSQPFSAYMTSTDAEWVIGKDKDNPIKEFISTYRYWFDGNDIDITSLPNEFIYYLRKKISAYRTQLMQFLWPWYQHLEVMQKQAEREVEALGYTEESSDYYEVWSDAFLALLEPYFNSRQQCEGCLPVEYDSY
jgi:hypothetical protein